MNPVTEPQAESTSVTKQALIDKAIEQIIPPAAHPCPSPAVKEVRGDMEAFLAGMLVFHLVGKR